jgi:hypothetical protein
VDIKKRIFLKSLLITGISLWFLFFPAYQNYFDLEEVDFFSSCLNWENPDQQAPLVSLDKKGNFFSPQAISTIWLSRTISINWIPQSLYETSPLNHKSLILRY